MRYFVVLRILLLAAAVAAPTMAEEDGEEAELEMEALDPDWKEDPNRVRRFWDRGASAEQYQRAIAATGQWPRRPEGPQSVAQTSWTPLGPIGNVGNHNGRIAGIHVRSDGLGSYFVYAGACNGGLWRARESDGIGHWTSLGDGLPIPSVRAFAVDPANPDRIIVGTGDWLRAKGGGMYRTTNAGGTWTEISLSPTPNAFFRIYHLPTNPSILIAASDQGILRSTDGGTSWTYRYFGVFTDLVLHPTNPNTQFTCARGAGIFKSTDAGVTWTAVLDPDLPPGSQFSRGSLTICRDFPLNIALLVESGNNLRGVYRSTNGGAAWDNITNNLAGFGNTQLLHAQAITYRPNDPNQIYVGAIDIARTTNGGTSWLVGGTAAGISCPRSAS